MKGTSEDSGYTTVLKRGFNSDKYSYGAKMNPRASSVLMHSMESKVVLTLAT